MGFLKEAKDRWGTAVPPFFKKMQLILGAVAVFGTALVALDLPGNWAIISKIGGFLIAGSGVGIVVAQFVMNIATILSPGESLHNNTNQPVEVAVVGPVSETQASAISPDPGLEVKGDKK